MDSTQAPSSSHSSLQFVSGEGQTHRGIKRVENQDAVLVVQSAELRVYAVADGMGGTRGGGRASQVAISTLEDYVRRCSSWDESTLSRAFRTVHERIRDEAVRNPEYATMGTTLVCLAIHGGVLYLANVGDSRAYLVRQGTLQRLTLDHTVVADLVRAGTLSAEQAASTPISHMLTQSLGSDEKIEIDAWIALDGPAPGDKYLLCSDGLYTQLTEAEIASICMDPSAADAVQRLVHRANEAGGSDNISVVLVDVASGYPSQRAAGAALVLQKFEGLSGMIESTSISGEQELRRAPDSSTPQSAELTRISVGPVQALFFVCVAFLSGLFLGSEALVMTSSTQPAQLSVEPSDESRASFGVLPGQDAQQPKVMVERARELSLLYPRLRASLALYEVTREQYLARAEELLMSPPNVDREKAVLELLAKYENARIELEKDLDLATQTALSQGR